MNCAECAWQLSSTHSLLAYVAIASSNMPYGLRTATYFYGLIILLQFFRARETSLVVEMQHILQMKLYYKMLWMNAPVAYV